MSAPQLGVSVLGQGPRPSKRQSTSKQCSLQCFAISNQQHQLTRGDHEN